jgi:hypothetical protein
MSDQLRIAAQRFCHFIHENCGTTDDWPMEINFDDQDTAERFGKLLNRLAFLAHEDDE